MKKGLIIALACILTVTGSAAQKKTQPSWLSDAVFYQIYPSSYQDSDGDGYGDLQGIISRLDYIRSIGVTAIWLNPVYVSGWTDGGYDIIDYYRVDKRFGDNDDLIALIREAHARGIKVVMDLVAGHSSDQCEWFLQSKEGANYRTCHSERRTPAVRSSRAVSPCRATSTCSTEWATPSGTQSESAAWHSY